MPGTMPPPKNPSASCGLKLLANEALKACGLFMVKKHPNASKSSVYEMSRIQIHCTEINWNLHYTQIHWPFMTSRGAWWSMLAEPKVVQIFQMENCRKHRSWTHFIFEFDAPQPCQRGPAHIDGTQFGTSLGNYRNQRRAAGWSLLSKNFVHIYKLKCILYMHRL